MQDAHPKKSNDACTKIPSGSIALLFSGGLDTTLEVGERLDCYRQVYLLTFNNGYCINMAGARGRVEQLRAKFGPDRIVHSEVHTAALIRTLLADKDALWKAFGSPLIYDLACKMASLAELIVFARANGVQDVSDGGAIEQTQIFLQHPEFSKHVEPCVTAYGLRLCKPVMFKTGREEKLARLKSEGFATGTKALERVYITSQLKHQPFCLRGFVTFFFTSPLRKLGPVKRYGLSLNEAQRLWDRLWPIARRIVDERLSEPFADGETRHATGD